ncbi:MAG: LysR family transcriptional regulator, partial [Syntrophomonadaceae bacterium]|nr:LysR family transcriptional regulator [Syntrophomonadaceae bacterium]
MEFNQLESFLAVVKHKSFSKAAKELFLTQPTISNNIQNLENELETILLDRKSKVISLTDSGRILYKYAVELINIREQAQYNIREHNTMLEGKIEISASSIPEQYVLPYIIKDFTKLYPQISFSITHCNSQDIVEDIIQGKQNYGIVGAKYSSRVLEYINFYEDELVLATPYSAEYSLFVDNNLDLDILFSQKFLFRKEGSGTRLFVEKCLEDNNISLDDLQITSLIDSNEMIKMMITLGLGVSFISEIAIRNEIDLKLIKAFRIKDLDLKRNFYFVYHKNRTLSPIVELFKDFLEDWTFT